MGRSVRTPELRVQEERQRERAAANERR